MTSNDIVLGAWTVTGGYALLATAYAVRRAWTDGPERVVAWRGWKVIGAVLGSLGLIMGMFAFEKTIRETNQDVASYLMDDFLELKFDTTAARAVACSGDQTSQDAKNECFDFRNLDNQMSLARLRSGKHFTPIVNWQRNSHLDEIVKETNARIKHINAAVDIARERPILSFKNRIAIGFSALLLIATAVACSIGEATYQWRQECLRQRQRIEAKEPPRS